MSEDALFDDLDDAVPCVTEERSEPLSSRAWKLWCEASMRPPASSECPRPFILAVRAATKSGVEPGQVLARVRHAVFLPVGKTDAAKDTKRVISVLKHPGRAAAAERASRARGATPYFYQSITAEEIETVERACEMPSLRWSDADHEAALILVRKHTPEEILDLGDEVAMDLEMSSITPSELLSGRRAGKQGGYRKAPKDTYAGGVAEDTSVDGIDFDVDPEAASLHMRGAGAAKVRAFHGRAPDGYWRELAKLLEEGEMLGTARARLEKVYGWHPSERRN